MPKRPLLIFACDESSQTTNDFMVMGGIACPSYLEDELNRDLLVIKGERFVGTEVKWSKTKNGERLALHKRVVDHFFSRVEKGRLHFHGMVVPFNEFDHHLREGGNKSESVSRMYYQLCLHRPVRYYAKTHDILIKPDHSESYLGFRDYHGALNKDAYKKFGVKCDPVRDINFCHSHKSALLQMNDLIIGGIAHDRNCRHEAEDASDHKCELARYVVERVKSFTKDHKGKFTIWDFRSGFFKAKSRA